MSDAIPYDLRQARRAERWASRAQRNAEQAEAHAGRELAKAEEEYRVALTTEIERLSGAGVADTACEARAKGAPHIARLRRLRDEAKAEHGRCRHAVFRASKDRDAVQRFNQWSYDREIAEGYGRGPAPMFSSAFGAAA